MAAHGFQRYIFFLYTPEYHFLSQLLPAEGSGHSHGEVWVDLNSLFGCVAVLREMLAFQLLLPLLMAGASANDNDLMPPSCRRGAQIRAPPLGAA